MSKAANPLTKNLPGYGPLDRRCLPYSGLSGRVVATSPCFCCSHLRTGFIKNASKAASTVCRGSSGGQWRNSDFPKQNRHSFSRNRDRQTEDRDIFDNMDESALLTSKNGQLLSVPNTSKSQSQVPKQKEYEVPLQREKEIVELFKKIQAELSRRAAAKKGKKAEVSESKEDENVRSLLRVLKKHKINETMKRTSSINSDLASYRDKQNGSFREAKTKRFVNTNNKGRNSVTKSYVPSSPRPPSNFQRKSPVSHSKFELIYSSGDSVESATHPSPNGERNQQYESHPDDSLLPDLELESSFTNEDVFNEPSEGDASVTDQSYENQQQRTEEELSSMNVPELRAIAKSRGLKGYSKMKKNELLELLGA